jgi:hypothetical protein
MERPGGTGCITRTGTPAIPRVPVQTARPVEKKRSAKPPAAASRKRDSSHAATGYSTHVMKFGTPPSRRKTENRIAMRLCSDGASRTRAGDLLGAIRACAALEWWRFAGRFVCTRQVRPVRMRTDYRRLPGVCPPKRRFGGKGPRAADAAPQPGAGCEIVALTSVQVGMPPSFEGGLIRRLGERRAVACPQRRSSG